MRPALVLAIACLFVMYGSADALELKAENPDFTVNVPNLPSVRLERQTTSDSNVSTVLAGTDGTYKITLLTTRAQKEITTRECAGAFLRSLLARAGMPDRDNVYRTALDEDTFLVLYILVEPEGQQLHAHLLSSANATHCVEMHVSRARVENEEQDGWRQSFAGSHVQESVR